MRQLTVHKNDENQRLDKYLKKYLKEAPGSFIYKMLRKKNIVLNGKKADGTEKLSAGDEIKLFFAEDTLQKFTGEAVKSDMPQFPIMKNMEILSNQRKKTGSHFMEILHLKMFPLNTRMEMSTCWSISICTYRREPILQS